MCKKKCIKKAEKCAIGNFVKNNKKDIAIAFGLSLIASVAAYLITSEDIF